MAKPRVRERISLIEVERIAFRLAQEHLAFDEPIPDFSARFPGALESCLGVPFQTFSGQSPYRSLVAKASILLYLMIKNHPFQNGNKRIAVTTLLVFLLDHGKWLAADRRQFYRFTVWIAASQAREKDYVVMAIESFIRRHLVSA